MAHMCKLITESVHGHTLPALCVLSPALLKDVEQGHQLAHSAHCVCQQYCRTAKPHTCIGAVHTTYYSNLLLLRYARATYSDTKIG